MLADKHQKFLQIDTIILGVCSQVFSNYPKYISFQYLREKWVMKLVFCMQISMKLSYKLILCFWWEWSCIPKVSKIGSFQCLYNISKKKKIDFLNTDKHQSFLQLDFNTLGIKVSYSVILSLLIGMIRHKVISLQ